MADFGRKYIQITDTDLWKYLDRKCDEENMGQEFLAAVEEVCAMGLELSRDIIRWFPNFTLHDIVHSANVCRWMWQLLGEQAENLTVHEAALLLMSACCHDMGMAVSRDQERRLRNSNWPEWKKHFQRNSKDEEEFSRTKTISDQMIRSYVRQNHHLRVKDHLVLRPWPRELARNRITQDALQDLCESHGMELSRDKLKNKPEYDMLLCAVLLRLADLLDFDEERSPEILWRHMGLDHPDGAEEAYSAEEQRKNQVGEFSCQNGSISYSAEFDNLKLEKEVREYLDWVTQELHECSEQLRQNSSRWNQLELPYKIDTEGINRVGYKYGDFCLTMDQDKVIDLLAGKNIYSDPGVFVRELLQNAIDAVLMRAKQDPAFSLDQGRIIVDTWPGEAGDTWFRIRDNGLGMDEHIIRNYFLKVGRSYYTSDEFRAANRRASGGKYTAISRFGIGILSCFMTDPDYTELKVSTKRFNGDGENGIRLDVTGLHGYYYLSCQEDYPDYGPRFVEMPSPDEDDRGYRMEPGTTICVKTNLFRMGTLTSFREILDKYVQFPEVRVEYNGPEGHKEYPTQQELMDAVHALNPGGEIREYVHELPEDMVEEIKEAFPIFQWKEDPALVLRYYPIDWLSDSENMTGVFIKAELRYPRELREDVVSMIDFAHASISCEFSDEEQFAVKLKMSGYTQAGTRHLLAQNYEEIRRAFYISASVLDSFLSVYEKKVLDFLNDSMGSEEFVRGYVTYQGVLADYSSHYAERDSACISVLILRDSFLPEVNVARTYITQMPLEALCCMDMLTYHLYGMGYKLYREYQYSRSMESTTERELQKVLQCHPDWIKM